MERATRLPAIPVPSGVTAPTGIPANIGEHLRLMCDLLVLAFQTDSTRIATFVFANEASNRSYPDLGVNEGHHEISHHGRDPEKIRKVREINQFHIAQPAPIYGGAGSLCDVSEIHKARPPRRGAIRAKAQN